MKKSLQLIILLFISFGVKAQNTPGPVEKDITDKICNCLVKLDMTKITTTDQAKAAYMDCVMQNTDLFEALANERKVDMTDQAAMREIGVDIGKNLLRQKCTSFTQLSLLMAKASNTNQSDDEEAKSTTTGTFKRIDLKGFNYIVVSEKAGSEKSFLWFRQFPGSENFTNGTLKLAGKKLKIDWREVEVYLPQAKGYYKVKEILSIDIL